ncbi:MAG: D-alanyl-D-alanine carboxypeptidase/D-alanyl-D-alanine-endopeptidase [Ignavibacteriales bacterium]|nr:MAG: D-alanyl-D-alanine carboxypeptidase/D-alanyl-D-alanine-endopeptidase [Ignavibacteriaceae bacterium]MBW7874222.1 D-alanyl-D-alanine carboxypeptidase/D-alanyl-D-alanine-endopeptidase [Ignavibacteria bacterium]MCZ2142306.1 D-alanyl-D-alanine carboxypeptidase/D-alanyl-D-alanine-endopeptidase [Ignavibacteriales bacterium]OQY79570.1 MAG: D-alanyl-D-alanine carboxypeptidase/D-alanyl-D-alanine-endopeptidase [Ignavibacteriales bacterium UTCHB3]MBV6445190.1 D-alanyl-D-alanine carboxypeptidase Dac
MYIKKFTVLIVVALFSVSGFGQGSSFTTEMQTLLNDPFFTTCNSGIKIYNITKKKEVFAKDEHKLMNPASNMKVITGLAGLYFLGKDYQFRTSFGYTGKIEGNRLNGDLVVVGYGDPDFKLDSLNKMLSVLSATGIKEVTGDILVDVSFKDSLFWGEGWMWDDDGAVSSPFMSALNINDNTVKVTVSPKVGGAPVVAVYPVSEYFTVENDAKTGNYNDLRVWRDYLERTNKIFVKGSIAAGSQAFVYNFNVWKPELYFGTLLKETLQRGGISVKGSVKTQYEPYQMTTLYEFNHIYSKLINQMIKKSDNLYAEMVLLSLGGLHRKKNVSFNDGKKYLDSLLIKAGVKPAGFRFADGSGVSRYDVASADLLVRLLNMIQETGGDLYQIFYNSLPIAGVDGTLSGRMKGGKCFRNLRAKTGSLSGVSTLSGYVKAESGDLISFSILMQNFTGPTAVARDFQDKICELIVKYN